MENANDWWGKIIYEDGVIIDKSFGDIDLRFSCRENNWCYYLNYLRDYANDGKWTNIGNETKIESLDLESMLPDRPIVFYPDVPLLLPPNSKVKIYVKVPLWCRIMWQNGVKGKLISEFPLHFFSKSWFGSKSTGFLSYTVRHSVFFSLP
ncbi:MAG: hypothetical protein ACRC37_02355, partial [Lentisphaeria bacterium]